ncbi:hypothetical protein VTN00DRAFT_1737 [Thermoascus crustaceus]|uniref:uncharacterized protein n=1 Tax=Thermoascus crustaceus TaxID=5088 RepID=UPI003742BA05
MEPNNRGDKKSEQTSCMAAQREFSIVHCETKRYNTSCGSSHLLASAEKRILQEKEDSKRREKVDPDKDKVISRH